MIPHSLSLSPAFHSPARQSLTAHEPTRPLHIVCAMSDGAANRRRVAPDHLGEVAPLVVKVRVVVGVDTLFLVPAVGGGAGELDPGVVGSRGGPNAGEVGSWTLLYQTWSVSEISHLYSNHR